MLKNIKSSYFKSILFSFIDERQKLKVLKYNKSLQNNINISIINYKFFTGKYIIYDTNRNGKEYNGYDDYEKGKLQFEGEYLNGKKHEKIKEYFNNGDILFEGEYLNGKKHGKGKEYHLGGKLRFEGEYLMIKNGLEFAMINLVIYYVN